MLTVLSIIGTRPEAIKIAPVVREFRLFPGEVRSVLCSTGQHRDLLEPIFKLFDVRPDVVLDVMTPDQDLAGLTSRLLDALDPVIRECRPDWVLAQGDTTTVLAASLVAFYRRVPFAHLEAGLRTGNLEQPFPEELNRKVADQTARLLFAPTETNRQTLLKEGIPSERIHVTGNTVVDALRYALTIPYDWSNGPLARLPLEKRLVLVTAHRRESFGVPFEQLCQGLREVAERLADEGVHLVFPVHLNPNVRRPVERILSRVANVSLLEPLDYLSLAHLMRRSALILTDSGGIQEEAPDLHVPVLVMRETTERPEGIQTGAVRLVGTCPKRIVEEACRLLTDPRAHAEMTRHGSPYGDGHASRRIVEAFLGASRA